MTMTDRKTLILAQLFITFMMAFSMSGIMSLISMGPTREWLHAWPLQFITAWPIAFVLTLIVSKVAFALAFKVSARIFR